MSKLKNVAIAFDQLCNTILGGYPDETLSARSWRLKDCQPYKFLRAFIDTILWFDPNHCETSYMSEKNRTQSPADER